MKTIIAILITILSKAYALENMTTLTPQQVYAEIQNHKNVSIYDVNPQKIYNQSHLPTAKNISYTDFENQLPLDKQAKIIFYCMNEMCTASHSAAKAAASKGYKNVFRMPSGIKGWIEAKLPTESVK